MRKFLSLLALAVVGILAAPAARADNVPLGSPATLTATADGTAPFTYEWSKAGVVIAGQTKSTLVFASVTLADSAVYSAKISNPWGTATGSATLNVVGLPPTNPKLTIIQQIVAWLKSLFGGKA